MNEKPFTATHSRLLMDAIRDGKTATIDELMPRALAVACWVAEHLDCPTILQAIDKTSLYNSKRALEGMADMLGQTLK